MQEQILHHLGTRRFAARLRIRAKTPSFRMIRLTRCTHPSRAGSYFRLHLATGDNQKNPAAPSPTLRARWTGPALADVALVRGNTPEVEHLVRLCRGLHPTQQVRLAPSVNRKRAYYDVVVTAPKTVSLAALLNPNHPTARWVMNAHLKAVEEVTEAVAGMLQPQSKNAPKVSAWLAAIFTHTHTREGDPHLHSHLVLPNVMRNIEGNWRAMQVNISGANRTHLGLIYGHALTKNLRQIGFTREELVIQRGKAPELRALLPLVPRFSKARRAVLAAAAAAEAKRPLGSAQARRADDERAELHSRSGMPVPAERPAMQRRARLADQIRRPKPKDADNPVKLGEEASRWHRALANQEARSLIRLLDELDVTNPRRRVRVVGKLPARVASIVQAAFRDVCAQYQRNPTESLLLRSAVAHSAGRHPYEELLAACQTRLAAHEQAYAAMMARIRADFVADEEAALARQIASSQATLSPQSTSAPPAIQPPVNPAPGSTGQGVRR